jgi:hypothetical protein
MSPMRAVTRGAVAVCVASVVLLIALSNARVEVHLAPFIALHLAALGVSLAARLCALRSVFFAGEAMHLSPILGPSRRIVRIVDVYETADDVVVLDRNGKTFLLGVDRLGGRDPERTRRALVDALRNFERMTTPAAV